MVEFRSYVILFKQCKAILHFSLYVIKSVNSEHNDFDQDELKKAFGEILSPIAGKKRIEPRIMMDVIVKLCKIKGLTNNELAGLLGRSQDTIRTHYLTKLCDQGRLHRKYPNIKNHPDQKYLA